MDPGQKLGCMVPICVYVLYIHIWLNVRPFWLNVRLFEPIIYVTFNLNLHASKNKDDIHRVKNQS